MSGLNSQLITGHEQLSENVAVTTYEDSTRVYVNYSNSVFDTGAVQVPARDYLVERGDAE